MKFAAAFGTGVGAFSAAGIGAITGPGPLHLLVSAIIGPVVAVALFWWMDRPRGRDNET